MTEKYTKAGKINEQWLAEEIAKAEGKKESVNIAQIKEILRITLEQLAALEPEEVIELLAKHQTD